MVTFGLRVVTGEWTEGGWGRVGDLAPDPLLNKAGSMAWSTCRLCLSPVSILKMTGALLSAFSADCIREKYSMMTSRVTISTSARTVT